MSDLDSIVAADDPSPPPRNAPFSIWPPSQRTRDAVTARLVETLSAPSALSKRYGTISRDDADSLSRRIEHDAFSAVDVGNGDGDGIAVLEAYSREISRRVLDAVKATSGSAPSPAGGGSPVKPAEDAQSVA